jgi:lipopolysaccharide heptosyltransferase II
MNKNKEVLKYNGMKSILVVRLSSLGDILLSTPLVRTIKNKFPDISISFIVKKQYRDTLKLNPHLTRLFLYEPQKEKRVNLINEIKKNRYDLILDLQNNFRSKEITNSLHTKTLRFPKRSLDKFLLVNFKINRLKEAPPIPERYSTITPGLNLDSGGLELYTENKPSSFIKGKENLVGIAPGSRHFTKMWPKDFYVYLGKLLVNAGYNVVIFGGKDDISICTEISESIKDSVNLCNNDDLLQTAADMKECLAIICNDSGLMHTACALKVPVLTFFGSSVKEFGFTPYKNNNLILENNSLTCRPCSHIGRERCPKGHFRCMLEISPEKAFEELITLLEK